MPLLSSAESFKNNFSTKNSFRNTIKVSNGLDLDQDLLLVLIWVQTVCKSDQHAKKLPQARKGLKKATKNDFHLLQIFGGVLRV